MRFVRQLYKLLVDRRRQDQSALSRVQIIIPLVIVALGVLTGASVATYMWNNNQRIRLQALEQELEYVSDGVQASLMVRASTVQRMANRWIAEGGITEQTWYAGARDHIKDFPALSFIAWTDRDLIVRYTVFESPFLSLRGEMYTALESRKEELNRIVAGRESYFSVPFKYQHAPEITGLVILYPIFNNDAFDGFIVGIVNLTELYNSQLTRLIDDGYTIAIEYDDEIFYHA